MKDLKAFINKDVIKRMKHNDSYKLYIVVPYGVDEENLLNTRFSNSHIRSKDNYDIYVVKEEELLSMIDEIKEVDGDTQFLFVLEHISVKDLKEKISRIRWYDDYFNGSISCLKMTIDDIRRNRKRMRI